VAAEKKDCFGTETITNTERANDGGIVLGHRSPHDINTIETTTTATMSVICANRRHHRDL
jgi:hypothetical protein